MTDLSASATSSSPSSASRQPPSDGASGAPAPSRPGWTSNATSADAVDHSAELKAYERKLKIADVQKALDALFKEPKTQALVKAIDARDGGILAGIVRALRQRVSGAPLGRDIGMTKYGFYYLSESAKSSYLQVMPEAMLLRPGLVAEVSAAVDKALRDFRATGQLAVHRDYGDYTAP